MFRLHFRRLENYRRVKRIPVLGRLARLGLVSLDQLDVDDFHRVLNAPPFVDLQGTRKDTARERFRGLDPLAVEILDSADLRRSPIRVHDVGVSSGITSLELMRALSEAKLDHQMTISDRFCRIRFDGGLVGHVFGPTGRFLEGWVGPIVADPKDRFATVPITVALGKLLRSGASPVGGGQEILLFVPELRRLIERGEVQHIDYDVLSPGLEASFDYVRCMNVLNRVYFDETSLRTGLAGLARMLDEGGVLQVGRTEWDSGQHLVSFFRRHGDRLRLIQAISGGADVASLIPDCLN